jgi:hypothetical protein
MTSSSGTARSPVEGLTPDLGGESTEAGPSATMGAARAIDHRIVRDLKVPPRLDRGPTDGDPRRGMMAAKGRVPVTTPTHPVDRSSPSHVASPVVVRLAAAAIVTACAAVAKSVAGPRAAAATGVIGTLIAVVLLTQLG